MRSGSAHAGAREIADAPEAADRAEQVLELRPAPRAGGDRDRGKEPRRCAGSSSRSSLRAERVLLQGQSRGTTERDSRYAVGSSPPATPRRFFPFSAFHWRPGWSRMIACIAGSALRISGAIGWAHIVQVDVHRETRKAEDEQVEGGEFAGLVTPETILRWYRELIAGKYDSSARRGAGRPATAADVQQLVVPVRVREPELGSHAAGWRPEQPWPRGRPQHRQAHPLAVRLRAGSCARRAHAVEDLPPGTPGRDRRGGLLLGRGAHVHRARSLLSAHRDGGAVAHTSRKSGYWK